MRILIYGINYAPELTGIGKYSGEMAEWLVTRGHEVRVVCAPPYYPSWRIAEGYSARRYSREMLNGVTVLRCPLWVPSRQSGIRRILHLLSFAFSSLPVVIASSVSWRPQAVFVLEPAFFCTPAALVAARLAGSRAWLHIQDLEIDAAFSLGLVRSGLLKRMISAAERLIMKRFDRVSTISASMLDNVRQKGVPIDFSHIFPNWVDSATIYPLQSLNPLRAEWGIDRDAIVVLYSGNMGEKQGLEVVVDAARILAHDSRICFVLSGDGAARKRLEVSAGGLGHIRFTPLQPAERLNELLNLADIHVLPQRPDVACLVMPSKLLGMLASGRPVVATADAGSELGCVVSRCGIVTKPGDARGLADALQMLAGSADLRGRLGAAARSICVEQWDRENVLTTFENSLVNLSGGSSHA
ncbi:MAG: glycosyltransferase WbuB [Geobacteraceae bacterium]|nr:glycosyltransferase WbuB [Geobacteraceae bacterium]